jgi:aspartyl-tRNA(Asn)/glutamyl-tRNA(Gln) amidotransferase subunit A
MPNQELAYSSATNLLQLISSKQVSPVELTKLFLERIDRLDPQLNSYLLVTYEQALAAAKAAEEAIMRGDDLGPLHGLPISVKDTQMTKGIPTTTGSLLFKDRIPQKDAAVIERVKDAGAIILGKTNTSEFALVGMCENRLGDHGRNPWNPDYTPGGSSGGAAAATAAFLCPFATGGDGGGSIRIPASLCGIYGIKPTQGRVSGYSGVQGPPSPNLFGQQGPLSRTVRDSALLLQVLAGHDSRDPNSLRHKTPDFLAALKRGVKGLRIAWSPNYGFASVEDEVLKITSDAARVFQVLGAHIGDAKLKMDDPYRAFGPIYESAAFLSYGYMRHTHGHMMTHYAREFLDMGSKVTVADYSSALGRRDQLKAQVADVFEQFDLIVSPTLAVPGVPVGQFPEQIAGKPSYPHKFFSFHPFTYPINVVGHPAASIPAGFASNGLPVGLQIVGRMYDEETVIAASAAFEKARPWIDKRPPVS